MGLRRQWVRNLFAIVFPVLPITPPKERSCTLGAIEQGRGHLDYGAERLERRVAKSSFDHRSVGDGIGTGLFASAMGRRFAGFGSE